MAAKKTAAVAAPVQKQKEYAIYTKKVVWVEALCVLLIWLFFIIGLVLVFYMRDAIGLFSVASNVIMAGILMLSIAPFMANWEYYTAIWKAWREGREIIYKEPAKNTSYSVLGNREVWIKQ